MPSPLFIHLRNHSAYSLAEGMLRLTAKAGATLTGLARQHGQPAVALTDSFNAFGALEFSDAAAKDGIQPIIGIQVNVGDGAGRIGEVVLLVQSETGWQNLSQLVSDALLDDTDPPVIPVDAFDGKSDGLIMLSGGARSGFIAAAIAEGQESLAVERIGNLKKHFDGRLYIEIQRHGIAREKNCEAGLIKLAYDHDLPLVATNDCYFATRESITAHNALLCISQSTTVNDESRRAETAEHYFKSSEEMARLFADLPEAVSNTVVVAKRCAYRVPHSKPILPAFPVPSGMSEGDYLKQKAKAGLDARMTAAGISGGERLREYEARLDMEVDIIIKMGFSGYFLIVADFIEWAKAQEIPVGPGRGSGAGSLVAYALTITDLDPIRWGLLFERFLNPERISMPDFDIDFCQDRRDEVIRYVQEKYGDDRVAQIITFGSLQARAALRDVGRVLGMPYGQVDRIAKLVPNNPADPVTLEAALASEAALREERDSDAEVAELMRIAMELEGLYRHASTHAAGLVIGDRPLRELVPLYRDPRAEMPLTQFSMKAAESAGLVKFDFLGLKTLSVIQEAIALVNRNGGELSIDDIPLDDAATYEMLARGDTVGNFQLEGSGMRDVLRGLKPDRFEDIIAVVALYRPGPMENIPKYVGRKHGREEVTYMHPALEPVLAETYGIMVYQEQVQQAAQVLAGYTLGRADILRRAMGKKIKSEMDAERGNFVAGAGENGIDEKLASEIFDGIAAFAGYGFNKSHAAGYALIAVQTAWLKVHHPAEFYAASMTYDSGNTDKLAVFRQDCRPREITVLPPDVNASQARFSVERNGEGKAVRYALGAIKNVGMEAMSDLVKERETNGAFDSINDFSTRLAGVISKRFLENLIKAGALDSIEPNRNRLLGGLDLIVGHGAVIRREAESAMGSLFENDVNTGGLALNLPDAPEMANREKLEGEFEALGLYVSAHPLDDFAERLDSMGIIPSSQIENQIRASATGSARLTLAGVVTGMQTRISKKGNRFAFVTMTDRVGSFEAVVFTETLATYQALLEGDAPLSVKVDGRVDGDTIRLTAQSFELLEGVASRTSTEVELRITDEESVRGVADGLKRDGPGATRLKIVVPVEGRDVVIRPAGRYRMSTELRQMVKSLPGAILKELG